MAYSELFKNYSDIRNFMRRFYVYGFEKRQDFTAKSSRSYDDNRRRLDSWLEDYMSFKSEADGRATVFPLTAAVSVIILCIKAGRPRALRPWILRCIFICWIFLPTARPIRRQSCWSCCAAVYFNCFDNQLRPAR